MYDVNYMWLVMRKRYRYRAFKQAGFARLAQIFMYYLFTYFSWVKRSIRQVSVCTENKITVFFPPSVPGLFYRSNNMLF